MSKMGTIGDAAVIPCAISNTRVMKAIKDRGQPGGVSVLITCQKCEKIDSMKAQSQWDPTRVAKSFRNAGWEVDAEGRSARCPDCKKRRREAHPEIPIGRPVAPLEIDGPMDVVADAGVQIVRVVSPLSLVPARAPAPAPVAEPAPGPEAPPVPAPKYVPKGKAPGTVNHYKPKICAYPPCARSFVPTAPKQIYHAIECRRGAEHAVRIAKAKPAIPSDKPMRSSAREAPAAAEIRVDLTGPPAIADAAIAPPQTPEALKAERKMYTLLDEHYLADQRHYETRWNDERISAESGVALPRVTFVREGLYGKAVDPFMVALQEDVEAALARIKAERITLAAHVRETFDRQEKELRELLARTSARGG